jgi:signal transduction histidine kinase
VTRRPKRTPPDERFASPVWSEPPSAVSPACVLASLDEVVWSVSPDGQFVFFVAGAVERLYGLTSHELEAGRGQWLEPLAEEDRERLLAALASLPETGHFALEHRAAHPGGARRVLTRGKLVRGRDGRALRVDGITAAVPDAAEPPGARDAEPEGAAARLAEAEVAAARAAHLATAGRLAAGLAHDFNNLLAVVAGNADLIRESLAEDDPRRETADIIARTAQTVAGMNRKLLAVGKPGPARAAPLDAFAAIRALEPLLCRLVGKRVALAFELVPGLPFICADATQFDRVILNLVLNARDAIAASGTVTVRAAEADVEPGRAGWPANLPPGQYVAVTVADTGCGMTPEVRARMFEAYFTTKGDRGTGLGLATVLEVIGAARGHIEVESEPGWGTQVRVYWPAIVETR